ncbi:HupE/UreJ family protein [Gluconacetobacter sp. Hr-1-5]|uniref:HupE/UreJ family protein n=1 Tax=Gluconacetobacter sp. Hr-1-5 TaxID=3395370 RepID=UPI003B51C963
MTRRVIVFAVLFLLSGLPVARADVFNMGRFVFTAGSEPNDYFLTVTLPQSVMNEDALALPGGCREKQRVGSGGGARVTVAIEISCDRPLVATDHIGTPWRIDGATLQSVLNADRGQHPVELEDGRAVLAVAAAAPVARSLPQAVIYYSTRGVLHILTGWDHLTFVFCLCMLVGGSRLLLLITTFTVGHSISLALSFLHIVDIPEPPVEAVIALSIMFMAQEALLAGAGAPRGSFPLAKYAFVVGSFGLLHGLGFASALEEIGVASGERLVALASFNVGVEVGQLIFVALVTLCFEIFRRLKISIAVRAIALYAAGAMGAFWMIDRIASMFGIVAAI